jgi:hypothetical protein
MVSSTWEHHSKAAGSGDAAAARAEVLVEEGGVGGRGVTLCGGACWVEQRSRQYHIRLLGEDAARTVTLPDAKSCSAAASAASAAPQRAAARETCPHVVGWDCLQQGGGQDTSGASAERAHSKVGLKKRASIEP